MWKNGLVLEEWSGRRWHFTVFRRSVQLKEKPCVLDRASEYAPFGRDREDRHLLSAGRARSRDRRGHWPTGARSLPSAESTSPRSKFPIPTMRRLACFRSSITTAATSRSTTTPSISSSRRTSWRHVPRPAPDKQRNPARPAAGWILHARHARPTVGAFGPRYRRFLPHSSMPVRCRSQLLPRELSLGLAAQRQDELMAARLVAGRPPSGGPFFQRRHGERGNIISETLAVSSKLVAARISRRWIRDRQRSANGTFLYGKHALGARSAPSRDGKSLRRCSEAPAICFKVQPRCGINPGTSH